MPTRHFEDGKDELTSGPSKEEIFEEDLTEQDIKQGLDKLKELLTDSKLEVKLEYGNVDLRNGFTVLDKKITDTFGRYISYYQLSHSGERRSIIIQIYKNYKNVQGNYAAKIIIE